MQIRQWMLRVYLVALVFFCFSTFFELPQAHAQDALSSAINRAKTLYKQRQWSQTLKALERALKIARGKPSRRKAPIFLYVGLSLYQQGSKGLAWKALEEALYRDPSIRPPKSEPAKIQAFFKKVLQRAQKRGLLSAAGAPGPPGKGCPKCPPGGGGGGGGWGHLLGWIMAGMAGASLVTGIVMGTSTLFNAENAKGVINDAKALGWPQPTVEPAVRELRQAAEWQSTATNISFIAAGVFAAGSVALFLFTGKKTSAKKAALPPAPSSPRQAQLFPLVGTPSTPPR